LGIKQWRVPWIETIIFDPQNIRVLTWQLTVNAKSRRKGWPLMFDGLESTSLMAPRWAIHEKKEVNGREEVATGQGAWRRRFTHIGQSAAGHLRGTP
jgi:hypothetical protein